MLCNAPSYSIVLDFIWVWCGCSRVDLCIFSLHMQPLKEITLAYYRCIWRLYALSRGSLDFDKLAHYLARPNSKFHYFGLDHS